MKRFWAFALCCVMLLSLAACGAGKKSTKNEVGNTMSYSITKVHTAKDLKPENTDGFYKYYEASEGNTLFIVEMDVTNISKEDYLIWSLGEVKLTIDGDNYEAIIAVEDKNSDNSFLNGNAEIKSDETLHAYYAFDIPEDSADEKAVLSITSNEKTKTVKVKPE